MQDTGMYATPMQLMKLSIFLTTLLLAIFGNQPVPPGNAAENVQKSRESLLSHTSKKLSLASGDIVVVAEGSDEEARKGSYSIRLYRPNTQGPLPGHFSSGQIRPRSGQIENIVEHDLDQNGNPELIVIIRTAGADPFLTADAYSISGGYLKFLVSIEELPPDNDPLTQLQKLITKKTQSPDFIPKIKCEKITRFQQYNIPSKGRRVSFNQIRDICIEYGETALLAKIEKDRPSKPFQSDGCSMWFGSWNGVNLYPACFFHDLKYWAGYPDEEIERLIADAELMVDIACLTGSTIMAETMFQGTRLGGDEIYKQSFSWGFGRERK